MDVQKRIAAAYTDRDAGRDLAWVRADRSDSVRNIAAQADG